MRTIKTLITATEIDKYIKASTREIFVDKNTIITPAAKDVAREAGIKIIYDSEKAMQICEVKSPDAVQGSVTLSGGRQVDSQLVQNIIREVLAGLNLEKKNSGLSKKSHQSGLNLVVGQSVSYDSLNNELSSVAGIKEIFTRQESKNLGVGFINLDHTGFIAKETIEEVIYIIEGNLTCEVEGVKFTGQIGDVFYIPSGVNITFSTNMKSKYFFVSSNK